MKFLHRQIHSLEDAQRNFEQLEGLSTTWIPSGGLLPYAGTVAPAGYLLCDGTAYPATTFPALFNAIGYTYGGAAGTFHVPDLRGRTPLGAGTGSGLTARAVGQTGGEETHALANGEMPVHSHGGTTGTGSGATGLMGANASHAHTLHDAGGFFAGATNSTNTAGAVGTYIRNGTSALSADSTSTDHTHGPGTLAFAIANDGSGTAHNNMQPWACINYLIRT